MTLVERAHQLRGYIEKASAGLDDTDAANAVELFPEWKPGLEVKPGTRLKRGGILWKCKDGKGHTTQLGWEPENAASLWEHVDVDHAGTIDDPIPAVANMEYFKSKYYSEEGKLYMCIRDSEMALPYLPSQLVGTYFEETEG